MTFVCAQLPDAREIFCFSVFSFLPNPLLNENLFNMRIHNGRKMFIVSISILILLETWKTIPGQ